MSEKTYCERILKKFHMNDSNPKSIPCDLSINKTMFSNSTELVDVRLYREIVGNLIYVMTGTKARFKLCSNKIITLNVQAY